VQPVTSPPTEGRDPTRPWQPSPFTRLARTHALSVGGDAMFTAAMAGTVFFSVNSLDEARSRVALTLLFTIAPFAVAAPLLGPLIDRIKGGRRWMIIIGAGMRAVVAFTLIFHYDTLLLYLEGLLMLVLSKGYLIARGAMVPTVVRSDDELVKANARLTLLSGIAGAVAVVPAGLLLKVGGPAWALGLAGICFVVCTITAFQLPRTLVAAEPPDAEEKEELRGIGILLAASSMGLIRGCVGFLAFLIAFYAKNNDLPVLLGVGAVAGQTGFVVGALLAPHLRRVIAEERILSTCLALILGSSLIAALLLNGDPSSVQVGVALAMVSLFVGFSSNVAKQAFDAIVQRDAPDANRGRSFARFETRFQLVWVIGALIPTAHDVPLDAAMVFMALVAVFALVSYTLGWHRANHGLDYRMIKVRERLPRFRRVLGDASDPVDGIGEPEGAQPSEILDSSQTLVFDLPPVDVLDEATLLGEVDAPIPIDLLDEPSGGLFAPGGGVEDDVDVVPTLDDPTPVVPEIAYDEPRWGAAKT